MSNEVREAAERWRDKSLQYERAAWNREDDAEILADWAIAHPDLAADSDEPISEEWLRSEFKAVSAPMGHLEIVIQRSKYCETRVTINLSMERLGIRQGFPEKDEWSGVGLGSWPKTRGQLRRLLAALGIAKEGNNDA